MLVIGRKARARRRAVELADLRTLALYTRRSWIQRHRILCLSVLTVFALLYGFAWTLIGRFFLPAMLIPLAVLAGFVVWLLPETDHIPERSLRVGLFAYLYALLCWPDYIALDLPGLPWITLIRLIGIPLMILLLVAVSESPRLRAQFRATLADSPVIWKCVAGFAVIAMLSIGLSVDPGQSLSIFLVAQINWTGIFFLSCYVFLRMGSVRAFATSLWLIVVFVSLIAVREAQIHHILWAGHIPSFLAVQDESVQRTLAGAMRAGSGKYRAQAKFGTSLGLAEYLALATPFVLHFIYSGRTFLVRAAAVLTVPLIFYAVYLTDSRLAAIGLFASLALYLLYWALLRWRDDKTSLLGPMVTLGYPVIFLLMFSSTFVVPRIRAQVWGDGSQVASTEARKTMYRQGIPMIIAQPLGHGISMGGRTLGYTNAAGVGTIDTYFLVVGLEYGVIGFLVYYGMILWAAWKAGLFALKGDDPESEWLGPLAIALLNFFLSKSVFSNTENHALVFMMLGIVVAMIHRNAERARQAG